MKSGSDEVPLYKRLQDLRNSAVDDNIGEESSRAKKGDHYFIIFALLNYDCSATDSR